MRFLHTMLRVGNLQRSIDFYTQVLGMQLLRTSENPEYKSSLAFLGFEGGNPGQAEIELTYNWGVEQYELGTAYGHIALGVPDAYAACEKIKAAGGNVTRPAGPVAGGTTVIAFFLAEMGDKTQIATVALAARYTEVVEVVLGTTLGMMLANVPAVFLGDKIAKKVSMQWVHAIAAGIFAILGMLTLFNVGQLF